MIRHHRLAIALLAVIGFGTSPARAQDEITYYDRATKKEAKATGTIQSETPGQIVIKSGTAMTPKTFPVADVMDVVYNVPALIKPEYRNAINREAAGEKAAKE